MSDEKVDIRQLAAEIEALPIPEQLRLAAALLEERRPAFAHSILQRVTAELGVALMLRGSGR